MQQENLSPHYDQQRLKHFDDWAKEQDTPGEAAQQAIDIQIVQNLGMALLVKRKEAMEARKRSGIEDDWVQDEEFYQAIDAANPEGETNVRSKPVSNEGGPIGVNSRTQAPGRSTVFVPITRPYVDAASARIGDMLIPNDDMNWKFTPTPIDDEALAMQKQAGPMGAGQVAPVSQPSAGGAMMGALGSGMPPPGPQPANQAQAIMASPAAAAGAQQKPLMPEDTQKTADDIAAEKATKKITDWMIECQYGAEFRKMLENAAKLGTGILKGPFPTVRVSQRLMTDQTSGDRRLERIEKNVPISKSIAPQNLFPDPACGEDIQNGGYVWEYDTLSGRSVQDLLKDDSYIEEQVRKVLLEGPCKQGEAPADSPNDRYTQRVMLGASFGIWYFNGMVDKQTLMSAGVPEQHFADMQNEEMVPAVVTMINDSVVKCALSPMDSGGFPYDVMPWQRRAGMIWGIGVARQIRTPQRVVNAAWRNCLDNAGFAGGPQWAIRRAWVRPIDGADVLTPRKGWEMTDKAPDAAKIGDAISFTNIPMIQAEMSAIIAMGMKMAEDATGLPMLMQGQQGAAPDTVGGMTILNNNGSTVLRRIARQADDCVTTRHVRRYYHWLLENDDDDSCKGDFQLDVRASSALVDRELSNQALVQLAPILEADPAIHKERFHAELLRAHRIDPKDLFKTDAERAAEPPPAPPERVQVEQLRQTAESDRHMKELQLEAAVHEDNKQIDTAKLQADYEASLGELAMKNGISKDQVKAMLAKTVMTLNTQTALSNADRHHDTVRQVAQAAAEPPGRAPDGKAFTQ